MSRNEVFGVARHGTGTELHHMSAEVDVNKRLDLLALAGTLSYMTF